MNKIGTEAICPNFWFKGREKAQGHSTNISNILKGEESITLYCYVYSKRIPLFYMPVHLFPIINGFDHCCLSDRI